MINAVVNEEVQLSGHPGVSADLAAIVDRQQEVGAQKRAAVDRRLEEVENAEEEGVVFDLLTNPLRFIGDENGWVKEMDSCRSVVVALPASSVALAVSS